MKTVTLKQLRDYEACSYRYPHLVNALGPDWKDDQPIPLTKILETNGIDDCFWAFRCLDDDSELKMVAVKFAVFCSKQSLKFFIDKFSDNHSLRKAMRQAIWSGKNYIQNPSKESTAEFAEAAAEAVEVAVKAAKSAGYAAAKAAAEAAKAAAEVVEFAIRYDATKYVAYGAEAAAGYAAEAASEAAAEAAEAVEAATRYAAYGDEYAGYAAAKAVAYAAKAAAEAAILEQTIELKRLLEEL